MAWSALPSWVDGDPLTAAQLLAIKANLNETAPAKATTAGRIFAATGTNAIAEREVRQHYMAGSGTTSSTSFGNLSGGGANIGPTVASITTGPMAIINVQCQLNNSTAGPSSRMSYAVSGATTVAADDDHGILNQNDISKDCRFGVWELQVLTPGVQTVVAQYRVSSTTGAFSARTLIVMAL
jgi:hypothetical protein